MADEIQVVLAAQDAQFIASTKAASTAMAALAQQEERLGKVAAASGLDQKKFSQSFAKVEKQRAADAKKIEKSKQQDIKKAEQLETQASKKKDTQNRQLARVLLGRKALIIGEATGIGKVGVAALELSSALAAGGVAAAALLATIGVLAFKTAEVKNNTREMLDVLTHGRGDKALDLVDGLAVKLGQDITDTRDKFLEFRRAGLDNKQSAALLKLRADLLTVDHSGELAGEAVQRVLAFTSNGTQTAVQVEAASKTMKLLAKQAGVAGDGTRSAAAGLTTVQGALNRIDNDKTKILEQIGERIGPSVERAAQAMAKLADSLLNTKEGKATIDAIATSITKIADAATAAAPIVAKFIESGKPRGIAAEAYDAAAEVVSAFLEIPKAFIDVGSDINAIVNVIGGGVEDAFIDVGQDIWKALNAIPAGVEDIGGQIVDGIVSGIKNAGPKLLAAVEGVGSDIKNKFKNILGIHSPSLVFKGYGLNIGAGLNRGLERSMPDGGEMGRRMLPAPAQLNQGVQSIIQAQAAPIFGPRNAPAEKPTLVINITGGATEEDEAKARRAFERWWRGVQQQQGTL